MTLIHLLSFKNRIKLEINNNRKIPNTWRLNKTLLYNTWVKEKKTQKKLNCILKSMKTKI